VEQILGAGKQREDAARVVEAGIDDDIAAKRSLVIGLVGAQKPPARELEIGARTKPPEERRIEPRLQQMIGNAGDDVARVDWIVAGRGRQGLAGLERRPGEAVVREPADAPDAAVDKGLDTLAPRRPDVAEEPERARPRDEE